MPGGLKDQMAKPALDPRVPSARMNPGTSSRALDAWAPLSRKDSRLTSMGSLQERNASPLLWEQFFFFYPRKESKYLAYKFVVVRS